VLLYSRPCNSCKYRPFKTACCFWSFWNYISW